MTMGLTVWRIGRGMYRITKLMMDFIESQMRPQVTKTELDRIRFFSRVPYFYSEFQEDSDSLSVFFGSLPAFFNASRMIHSNCPLVLLNSSSAHFSTAFIIFSSNLRAKGFLAAIRLGFECFKLLHSFFGFFGFVGPKKEFFSSCFYQDSVFATCGIGPRVQVPFDSPASIFQ